MPRTVSANNVLGPVATFDEARKASVVCILGSKAVQTLIIKVLWVKTGDLLEAGRGEGKIRRTVLTADSVPRNRSGGPAAAGRGTRGDCGVRRDRVGAGVIVGASGGGNAADY